MPAFENVEVYVRVADYGFEGESVRFATIDENQAINTFSEDSDEVDYAPDGIDEELRVYVNGKLTDTWYREQGRWVTPHYSKEQREYGVVKLREAINKHNEKMGL